MHKKHLAVGVKLQQSSHDGVASGDFNIRRWVMEALPCCRIHDTIAFGASETAVVFAGVVQRKKKANAFFGKIG